MPADYQPQLDGPRLRFPVRAALALVTTIVLLLPAMFPGSALAQTATGTIVGIVQDENGQPIPFANVLIKGVGGVIAAENGRFQFDDVPVGTYTLTVDKRGDVIYLLNDGNTTGSARETAALVWAKDNTHLVGLCAPAVNQRSRITPTSGSTDVDAYTPFLTVSGHGNIFQNIALVQGNSEDGKASVGILNSGNRNYFNNVIVLSLNLRGAILRDVAVIGRCVITDNFFKELDDLIITGPTNTNVMDVRIMIII